MHPHDEPARGCDEPHLEVEETTAREMKGSGPPHEPPAASESAEIPADPAEIATDPALLQGAPAEKGGVAAAGEGSEPDDDLTIACPPGFGPGRTAVLGRAGEPAQALGFVGAYQLVEKIAQGGMGVVYKARQGKPNRTVALKMILSDRLGSSEDLERFQLEAEAAAKLDHPGIVPIFEVGEHDGQHFFSMGYVDGGSLAERLRDGPLAPRSAAAIMAQVADAVAYAHEEGIIHRDLKPSNILLDRDGKPRITDFGLAKNFQADSHLTTDGQVLGTPSFMPPEQAASRVGEIGPASDIYALGATLYCLLTGRPPFQAATQLETLKQVLEREPVSPRQLNAAVDRDLETICLRCLQKEPARRYAAASDFAADLRRFMAGAPIEARPISLPERAWRWCRRNKLIASLAACIVLSLLLGAITATAFAIRATREAAAARAAQRQSDRRWYVAEINRAYQDWKDGFTRSALARLDEQAQPSVHRSDPRGFEWYYLDHLCRMELATLAGHASPVRCVAFSPDGTSFASGSGPYGHAAEVHIWNTADLAPLLTIYPPWKDFFALAYSADGRVLAAAGADIGRPAEARLWDPTSGRELAMIRGMSQRGIRCIAFHPGGQELVLGESNGLLRLVTLEGKGVRDLRGHDEAVERVAISPDGKQLASADAGGTVLLWELAVPRIAVRLERMAGRVHSVAFSPDGRFLAAAGRDALLQVWDSSSGRIVRSLRGHVEPIRSVSFSPDGKLLASAGEDRTIRVWDLGSAGTVSVVRGHSEPVFGVAFAPDGWRLASAGGDSTVKLWDARERHDFRLMHGHHNLVHSVAFNRQGTRVASAGVERTVRIFDVATQRQVLLLQGHGASVGEVKYSPDGGWLATAGEDGTVRTWDGETGAERAVLLGHKTPVFGVAVSPDGALLASAGALYDRAFRPKGGALFLWDALSGAKIRELSPAAGQGDPKGYHAVDFSPDGRTIAAACGDQTARTWDAATGAPGHVLRGHEGRIWALAFSPLGTSVATASEDQTVRLWDLASARLVATLRGHTAGVHGVAFSPDGQRLASVIGGHGTTTFYLKSELKLWDVATAQEVLTLRERAVSSHRIAFSPDGRRLATADSDGLVTLWDAGPATPETRLLRSAQSLVSRLFDQSPRPELTDVARRLQADRTIAEPLRRAALETAQEVARDWIQQQADELVTSLLEKAMFREEVLEFLEADSRLSEELRREAIRIAQSAVESPGALCTAARLAAQKPGASTDAYHLALRRAQAACRLVPVKGECWATLGMAQYRLERNAEAARSLARAESLNTAPGQGPTPLELTFLAMALCRLGRQDEARAAFARLKQAMKLPEWSDISELQAHFREAQELFGESAPAGGHRIR